MKRRSEAQAKTVQVRGDEIAQAVVAVVDLVGDLHAVTAAAIVEGVNVSHHDAHVDCDPPL